MRILTAAIGVLVLVTSAGAQVTIDRGTININPQPPKPVGYIEFIEETGVQRWRVRLDGEDRFLRVQGQTCTWLDEVYKGMVTPLYDNMTFKTASGKECRVVAIER